MNSNKFSKAICFIAILQLLNSFEQTNVFHLKGKTFQGEIKKSDNQLILNILDYVKGEIYTSTITKDSLEKEFSKYLIFTEIDDLFNELYSNKQIYISDQHSLIIPIDITYKEKGYKFKIEISLQLRKFHSQAQKIQSLFQLIKQINEENQKMNLYYPQPIYFTGDRTNQKYKMFEHSQNNKRIKMLGQDQAIIYNHQQTVPKKGVHYFQLKVIKTANQSIFIGICGHNIKSNANVFLDPAFMGLYLTNGNLYGNNKNIVAVSGLSIIEGSSIVKVQIDMNKKVVLWYLDDALIYIKEIWKSLINKEIYPMVVMHTHGDIVQFINK